MERLDFFVKGSQGDTYQVTFEKAGAELCAYCRCKAGAKGGKSCKHRTDLMDGKIGNLLSGNVADVATLLKWMPGTALEAAYQRLVMAEKACKRSKTEAAKAERRAAKRNLDQVMYGRGGPTSEAA
jgi:hypothetical protein